MDTRAVLLVGLRVDDAGWENADVDGYRRMNWETSRARWERMLPDVEIFEGYHDGPETFAPAVAGNRAAALAGNWDLAVYVGADFMVQDAQQVRAALAKSAETGQLTLAHDQTCMLHQEPSERIRNGEEPNHSMGDVHSNSFTGVLTFPRPLWDAVGGFDERFVGWGWEDQAFWAASWSMGGGFRRVPGTIYHLWHPRDRIDNEENPNYRDNEILGRRYLAAKGNRSKTQQILAERNT